MEKTNPTCILVVEHRSDANSEKSHIKLIVKNGNYVGEFISGEIEFEPFNGSAQDLYKLMNFDRR
jgi:hypothetical protein